MQLYITNPSVVLPVERTPVVDKPSAEGSQQPCFPSEEFFVASAKCTREAAENAGLDIVDMLVDCRLGDLAERTVPSYSLAAESGMSSALPWSVGGLQGSEVPQAIAFLGRFDRAYSAVICAGQQVSGREERPNCDLFAPAGAVAALAVSGRAIRNGMQIVGVGMSQSDDGDLTQAIRTAAEQAICQATDGWDSIRWVIAHRLSRRFCKLVGNVFPDASHLVRPKHSETNFGSADTLVSLAQIQAEDASGLLMMGIAIFVGRSGAVGALALKPT